MAGIRTMAVAALLAAMTASARAETLTGTWLSEDGKLAVLIERCGGDLCGNIRWMKPKAGRQGPRLDEKNPVPALRDRPLCGLRILEGLEPDADGGWKGGRLYYPKHGRNYSVKVTPAPGGRVEMRAYLGAPFLGRTEIWERADAALPPCGEAQ